MEGLLEACRSGQFTRVHAAVEGLVADGYPAQELLLQMQAALLADASVGDAVKGRILGQLAETDKHLVDGSDEFLQLLAVGAHAQQALMGV